LQAKNTEKIAEGLHTRACTHVPTRQHPAMSFSKVGTGRDQNSLHAAEFACELGGKLGGMVAITRAPLARTMSGNIVREPAGRADVPLNHEGAPASRRSKRTMSQIRRVCPPDSELRRRIRKVLLSDPDHRMSDAVTMATRARCMKKLEVRDHRLSVLAARSPRRAKRTASCVAGGVRLLAQAQGWLHPQGAGAHLARPERRDEEPRSRQATRTVGGRGLAHVRGTPLRSSQAHPNASG